MPVLSSYVHDHAVLPTISANADFSTLLKCLASGKKSIEQLRPSVPRQTSALELLLHTSCIPLCTILCHFIMCTWSLSYSPGLHSAPIYSMAVSAPHSMAMSAPHSMAVSAPHMHTYMSSLLPSGLFIPVSCRTCLACSCWVLSLAVESLSSRDFICCYHVYYCGHAHAFSTY